MAIKTPVVWAAEAADGVSVVYVAESVEQELAHPGEGRLFTFTREEARGVFMALQLYSMTLWRSEVEDDQS